MHFICTSWVSGTEQRASLCIKVELLLRCEATCKLRSFWRGTKAKLVTSHHHQWRWNNGQQNNQRGKTRDFSTLLGVEPWGLVQVCQAL